MTLKRCLNVFKTVFGDLVFQQSDGILMGTNCAPLLAYLFLYSFEAEFIQKLVQEKNRALAVASTPHLDILMMSYSLTTFTLLC